MDNEAAAKGRALYHSVGCVACHAPQDAPPRSPNDPRTRAEAEDAARGASSLAHPEMKTGVAEMTAFLRDPLAYRPSGRMPSLRLTEEESNTIAMYLLRAQKAGDRAQQLPGLTYEYYEELLTALPKFERLHPKTQGVANAINLDAHRRDNFALRFRGNLTVPKKANTPSLQPVTTAANSSSTTNPSWTTAAFTRLRNVPDDWSSSAATTLLPSCTSTTWETGPWASPWAGPNLPRGEIPAAAFSHSAIPMVPVGGSAFTLDPQKIAAGQRLFISLNCVSCHALGTPSDPRDPPGKTLALLDASRVDGCIGKKAAGGLPQYTLSYTARAAIQATLRSPDAPAASLPPARQVERTMAALNRYACHNRDQRGGPESWSREYFTSAGDEDLGDEGRLAPHLDGVGARLRAGAIAGILWQGAVVRPYMATRMPQFGRPNVEGLVPALEAADDPGPAAGPDPEGMPDMASAGRRLAGVGGLACIACHNFNKHPSLGIPAIDMMVFLPGDRLAIFSRIGDIFIGEGIYNEPSKVKWTHFASGPHEVLGLAYRDGWIYAVQRPEVTRMKDPDGDGKADLFETFCDDWVIDGNCHEYAFGSKFDLDGNLWVGLCLTGFFTSTNPFRG